MAIALLILFMGFVPMVVYSLVAWWLDHWEREPLPLIIAAFAWGAVPAIILSLIFQLTIGGVMAIGLPGAEDKLTVFLAVIVAPLTEEPFKALALLLLVLFFKHEIDSAMDGIVYGAVIGFGFAAVENCFYFLQVAMVAPEGLAVVIFMRAFLLGLMHGIWTSLTGLGIALGRHQPNPALMLLYPFLGLSAAILLHMLHNALAVSGVLGIGLAVLLLWLVVFWMAVVGFFSLRAQGQLIRQSLQEEVARDTLTAHQAEAAVVLRNRASYGFGLIWHGNRHARTIRDLYELAADLAFRKFHYQKRPTAEKKRRVEVARARLLALSQQLEPRALR